MSEEQKTEPSHSSPEPRLIQERSPPDTDALPSEKEESPISDGDTQSSLKNAILFLLGSVLTPIVVTILTTVLIMSYIRPWADRPNATVLGVLPVHLLEVSPRDSPVKFRHHRFALILKIQNSSPSPAVAQMGLIDGCVAMSGAPFAAEISLPPEEQQSFDGKNISVPYERHKHTVQRIQVSGVVRDGPIAIPAYSTEYIGLLFRLEPGGAYHEFTGSVSLKGSCSDIKVFNTRPTLFQLIEMETVYRPRSLRPELLNGQLKLSLFVADAEVVVDPRLISKNIYSLPWKKWPDLLLAQMYENPESNFPPTAKTGLE